MKSLSHILLAILLVLSSVSLAFSTDFKSGEHVSITEPYSGDLYIGAGEIHISAPVYGDLIASGGEIWVEDSVTQDLLIAGGQLYLNGFVGDDIRAAGGRIKIAGIVAGDLVVFGGEITIEKGAVIAGDLIVFGGTVNIQGLIRGTLKSESGEVNFQGIAEGLVEIKADEVEINGEIRGASTIIAEDIKLGSQAKFYKPVAYWREDGEMDFGNSLVNTSAQYQPELEEGGSMDFPFGLAFGVMGLIYALTILLILILLNFLFNKPFTEAGEQLSQEPAKSLAYGAVYFICLPVIGVILLVTVIGIPIGLLLLAGYAFSWVFGLSIASVISAKALKIKYNYQQWNGTWMMVLVSTGVFMVLKLISLIPFIGWLCYIIIVAIAFGAIILDLLQKRKSPDSSKMA